LAPDSESCHDWGSPGRLKEASLLLVSGESGTVEAIFLAASHGALPVSVPAAVAHAGRGLEGDRNFDGGDPEICQVTLIEAEALDRLKSEYQLALEPAAARRQVLVRGVNLGDFIGRRFFVGEVDCLGEERCEPCNHLAGLVGTQRVLKGLLHTGLRASIVGDGTIRPGDSVYVHIDERG
jgi:MOSC domain-containing protein YiiM